MKKTCLAHRRSRSPTSSLSARLAAYSATAVAAVLGAPEAQATIQNLDSATFAYTMTTDSSSGGSTKNFTSFGAFHAVLSGQHDNSFGSALLRVGNGARHVFTRNYTAKNFARGSAIGGSLATASGAGVAHVLLITHSVGGQFLPPAGGAKTGYAGFKTMQHAKTYYGWLRIKVTAAANDLPTTISLLSQNGIVGAYGLAGDHITAGETAPEPGTLAIGGLGLLALGARGVRELRRRREAAAKN